MPAIQDLGAGVDWFTCTYQNPKELDSVALYVRERIRANMLEGDFEKPCSNHSYAGFIAGDSSLMHNYKLDRTLVQVTGSGADDCWAHIYNSLAGTKLNVTRLDLQVTVWYVADPAAKLRDIGEQVKDYLLERGLKIKTRYVDGFGAGDTLYIGSVESQVLIRIYDKGRESKHPRYKNSLRYEIQLRNKAAETVAAQLSVLSHDPEQIAKVVQSYLTAYGIIIARTLVGTKRLPIRTTATDLETRLRWLETTVKPSLEEAIKVYGIGYIRNILGLGGD